MKFEKLFGLCLLLVCSFCWGVSEVSADESKVYIPCSDLRESVIQYSQIENNEIIENELPTIKQIQNVEGEIFAGCFGSLEGVQYAKNASKLNCSGFGVMDFRPITGMTNLEEFYSYAAGIDELPDAILDIRPFGKLKKIKSLQFGAADIQDLTVLDELPNIETFMQLTMRGLNFQQFMLIKKLKSLLWNTL